MVWIIILYGVVARVKIMKKLIPLSIITILLMTAVYPFAVSSDKKEITKIEDLPEKTLNTSQVNKVVDYYKTIIPEAKGVEHYKTNGVHVVIVFQGTDKRIMTLEDKFNNLINKQK